MVRIPATSLITTPDDYGFVNHGGDYYFHDRALGKPPRYYQHILSQAERQIDIWDPYFKHSAAQVFDEVTQSDISINILTILSLKGQYDKQTKNDIDNFADEIKNILHGNGVTPQLYIQCYIKPSFNKIWHDRYLIIDEKEVYLIGTSLDEQIYPIKDFGIYRITNANDIELIKNKMQECINAGIRTGKDRNCYVRH